MCGIWACLGKTFAGVKDRMERLKGRGPEGTRHIHLEKATLGFSRLALNGLTDAGMQPMMHVSSRVAWICNGEIYNWNALAARHGLDCSGSDCSVLGPLWSTLQDPTAFFRTLDGVFAMALTDGLHAYVARDPYGVRPLFYTQGAGFICVASEMKALAGIGPIWPFEPGTWARIDLQTGRMIDAQRYHTTPWMKNPAYGSFEGLDSAKSALKQALVASVQKRLMAERPMAALLSGGLDSSLVAALVQRELKALGKPPLETFTVGFEGSQDVIHARLVADWIGSNHTEIITTPAEFLKVIPEVVHDIESYDITTVRASVGNWFVAREIRRRSGAKVIFNGDGADELFGSYLYIFRAPSDEAYEAEVTRLLDTIHLFDVLRSDRCISSHGLEPRTPFLDKQFVATVRSIGTEWLRPISNRHAAKQRPPQHDQPLSKPEKWLLRSAFESDNLLPPQVLWRQKEAFSDGVSDVEKPWFQRIHDFLEADDRLVARFNCWKGTLAEPGGSFSHLPPQTLEAFYYRTLFDKDYGASCETMIPYFWMPRWSGETADPSARTLSLYSHK